MSTNGDGVWNPRTRVFGAGQRCPGCGASPGQRHFARCAGPAGTPPPTPAERACRSIAAAHETHVTGGSSYIEYVAAVATALTLWRPPS